MTDSVEVWCAVECGANIGESPVWNETEQRLYWTSVQECVLHRFEPATGNTETREMPEELCCFAFREQGGLVAALRSGFAFIDFDSGGVDYIERPFEGSSRVRFNDGRCDRDGRFLAGTMDLVFRNPPDDTKVGELYRLDPDRSVTRVAGDVVLANGLAWSPDHHTMYWADWMAGTVYAFDYDPKTGTPANRRPFIQLGGESGNPDGAAVDEEGYYWIACFFGSRIVRISPAGEIVREIALPVRDPTMCAFGGPELDTLYITSAKIALDEDERKQQPWAGDVIACKPGVRGLPESRFAG